MTMSKEFLPYTRIGLVSSLRDFGTNPRLNFPLRRVGGLAGLPLGQGVTAGRERFSDTIFGNKHPMDTRYFVLFRNRLPLCTR